MTISDIFTTSDVTDALTSVLTDAGPYILAVFGLALTVSIAMALLGRAKRGVVNSVK